MPPHFPFLRASLTSMQYTTSQFAHNCCTISLSLSMIPINGKQWNQLPEFIPPILNSGLHQPHQHLHILSTCHLNNKTYPPTPDLHWHQYLYLCILYRLLVSISTVKVTNLNPDPNVCILPMASDEHKLSRRFLFIWGYVTICTVKYPVHYIYTFDTDYAYRALSHYEPIPQESSSGSSYVP